MRLPSDIIVHHEELADGTGIEGHYAGELIRCKDCKHALPQGEYGDWFICEVWEHQIHTSLNGFCYKAKRKEHENEP